MTDDEVIGRYTRLLKILEGVLEREHALASNEDVQKNDAVGSKPSQEKST